MELKTFEILTSKYSKILQAENMAVVVFRFMESVEDANDAKDIIVIVDTEHGKEFLTSENSLHKHGVSNSETAVGDDNFEVDVPDDCADVSTYFTRDGKKPTDC